MAWYRFYANNTGTFNPPDEEVYVYFEEYEDDPVDEERLNEDDLREKWRQWTAELGYGIGLGANDAMGGFMRADNGLPKEVRTRKLRHHNNVIDDAQRMIDVLLETPVAKEQGE